MNEDPTDPLRLLTRRQAADMLAVSEHTLWRATRDGEIRAVRLGTAVRYQPAEIQRYIAAHLDDAS